MGHNKREIATTVRTACVDAQLGVDENQPINRLSHNDMLQVKEHERDNGYEVALHQFSQEGGVKDFLQAEFDSAPSTGAIETAQMLHQNYRRGTDPYLLQDETKNFEEDLLNWNDELKEEKTRERKNEQHGSLSFTETDYLCNLSLAPPRTQSYARDILDPGTFQLSGHSIHKAKPSKNSLEDQTQPHASSQLVERLQRERVDDEKSRIAVMANTYPYQCAIPPLLNSAQNKYPTQGQWPAADDDNRLPPHDIQLANDGKRGQDATQRKSLPLTFSISGQAHPSTRTNQVVSQPIPSGENMAITEATIMNSVTVPGDSHGVSFEFSPVSETRRELASYRQADRENRVAHLGPILRDVPKKRSLGNGCVLKQEPKDEDPLAQSSLKKQKGCEPGKLEAKSELDKAEQLRLKRILRNRESARRSRLKSKSRFQEMERNFAKLKAENDALNDLVGSMLPVGMPGTQPEHTQDQEHSGRSDIAKLSSSH